MGMHTRAHIRARSHRDRDRKAMPTQAQTHAASKEIFLSRRPNAQHDPNAEEKEKKKKKKTERTA